MSLILLLFLSKILRISAQIINIYDERGSPCLHPHCNLILSERYPFCSTLETAFLSNVLMQGFFLILVLKLNISDALSINDHDKELNIFSKSTIIFNILKMISNVSQKRLRMHQQASSVSNLTNLVLSTPLFFSLATLQLTRIHACTHMQRS